jgi:RNA polymerase sigma factor (TIGR02999 family)
METPADLSRLFADWEKGDPEAFDQLIPLVYGELRSLASRYLRRERRGVTLDTSALVNELYIRLVDQRQVHWQDRAHFLAIAARLVRRILVDHARQKGRLKRGGSALPLELNPNLIGRADQLPDLVALNEALESLEQHDPRKCRVVELRFFAGLSVEETAQTLDISENTVTRDWNMAKAWLYRRLSSERSAL